MTALVVAAPFGDSIGFSGLPRVDSGFDAGFAMGLTLTVGYSP